MPSRLTTEAMVTLAMLSLGGCGGGGSSSNSTSGAPSSAPVPAPAPAPAPTPPASPTAQGLYIGTTSNGRTVTGVVLDNGTYWVIYSTISNASIIAGAIEGTSTSQFGNFTSTDARDFNLEGSGINDANVTGSFISRQFLNGTIRYTFLNQTLTFNAQYNSAYEIVPSVSTVAGMYTGTGAVLSGVENATLTIDGSGVLSGRGATSGCIFQGAIAPHAAGNVYDVSVTFAGGTCSNGTSTVTGIGYYDATSRRLYGTALNSGRTNGFIFVGVKP